ncbi:MAG: hypothetical protein AAB091_05255 [Elusimicrobiota bacterium]
MDILKGIGQFALYAIAFTFGIGVLAGALGFGVIAGLIQELLLGQAGSFHIEESEESKKKKAANKDWFGEMALDALRGVFNAGHILGRVLFYLGGAVGIGLGVASLAGATVAPVFVPIGFAIGGVALLSGSVQVISQLVKDASEDRKRALEKEFVSLYDQNQDLSGRLKDLRMELENTGIGEKEEVNAILLSIHPPKKPDAEVSVEDQVLYQRAQSAWAKKALSSLKQLKSTRQAQTEARLRQESAQTETSIQKLLSWRESLLAKEGEPFDSEQWKQYYLQENAQGRLEERLKAMNNAYEVDKNLSAINEAFNQIKNSPSLAYEDIKEQENKIRQERNNMRSLGHWPTVSVVPEDIFPDNDIAQSHGELSLDDNGRLKSKIPTDSERREEILETARSSVKSLPAPGFITSVPLELRDYGSEKKKNVSYGNNCQAKGSCLRIHEAYDVFNKQGTSVRNSFAGETVIAGDWGDKENQILINHSDGDQHDHAMILSGLLHNGFRDKKGNPVSGSGVLTKAGESVAANEVVALMGDTGTEEVKGKPHAHGEYYYVPQSNQVTEGTEDYEEITIIRKSVRTLIEMGKKYDGKSPPLNTEEYDQWKDTRIRLRAILVDYRVEIGSVKDKDGKTKPVFARKYGLIYQTEYKDHLAPDSQRDKRNRERARKLLARLEPKKQGGEKENEENP